MAIQFVSATNPIGMFDRLGRVFANIRACCLYEAGGDLIAAGLRSLGVQADRLEAYFRDTLQALVDNLYATRDTARGALQGYKNSMKALAEAIIIEQAHADAVLPARTFDNAIREVLRQLAAGSLFAPAFYLDPSAVSAAVVVDPLYPNVGNGGLTASVKRPDGRDNMFVYPETLEVICTADSQPGGGGTARQETFSVLGEEAVTEPLAWNWPGGSGATATLACVDADQNGSGNMLYNSNFNAFTVPHQPDYWGAALLGAYGTEILEESTVIARTGKKALRFFGTATAPSIAQVFGISEVAVATSGTTTSLLPNTVYVWSAFLRKSAGLAAGVFEARLVDGSDVQVNDEAGANIKTQIAAGTLTTSYAAYGGVFVTPRVMPTTLKVNLRASTGLTAGESIYIADLALAPAVPLYANGPWAAMFPGTVAFARGDRFKLTIANNRGGEMQEWLWRTCPAMVAAGLQMPTASGGTNIPDSLIS